MGHGLLSPTVYCRTYNPSAILATLNVSRSWGSLMLQINHLGPSAGIGIKSKPVPSLVSNRIGKYRFLGTHRNIETQDKRMTSVPLAGGFFGFGKKKASQLPEIVQAGDPVLHEPTGEVLPEEIGTERIQKIIDDMVAVMRAAPGVGIAAPQIGVPLQIIALEDTKEYISYAPKEEVEAQQRNSFDLLIIINPKLKPIGNKTANFFEGCLSVNGFRALVERHLKVEVTGLGRDGLPIKVNAIGWQARILQHECDHLAGLLYVDRMIPRTFRTVENLRLPLATGCPKPGVG
ncbi:hypothetical protein SUGI_0020160 [Cryptomeria japonica]|uniref:peptide deformylase 1A, chloroplastic n=1 Tax=Cryptomeria japonica TaxID=3369 RepID=UPI002408ED3A|nr:peptide deformylase 1A, chloroplastic [Cryptomeria japonica]GLJ05555.1 hypothetical protein SUGI_0020160 [Cryptomeria japonica]